PQMPPTSIFISAASSGMSGMGNSRNSVRLGPTRTAATTFSATAVSFRRKAGRSGHPRLPRFRCIKTWMPGTSPASLRMILSENPAPFCGIMRYGGLQMLGFTRTNVENSAALDRVREWTRARFKLTADETVMVSQIACGVPGCPPLETHVVFWSETGRHHFKIFMPVTAVSEDDLPPAFMKNALVARDGFECDCC